MKICFIGTCGHAYRAYCEMQACQEARFVGIAPGSEHETIEKLKPYKMHVFANYEQMLEETKPDVAVVSPVFGLTGRIIKYCAKRKIDVLAEKPIAASLEELKEVEDVVKTNKIHFCAMHFLRFTPAFYHAQKLVEQGAIGEIKLITAQKSYKYGLRPDWYRERKLYTGTIPWVGIHAIDWIYFFTKKKFLSVRALHHGQPEMAALCQFEMEDQVIASANIDYLRPQTAPTHGEDLVRIAGNKGIVEVFEDHFILINENGVCEYQPDTAPKLGYDFLVGQEELMPEEIFMITRVALMARESADMKRIIEME